MLANLRPQIELFKDIILHLEEDISDWEATKIGLL